MVPNSERVEASPKTENGGAESNWPEFKTAAKQIFRIWVYGSELAWARRAWSQLAKAGLTLCDSEIERTEACVRLMALGAVYYDFCRIVWESSEDVDLCAWADELQIQPMCVGRLFERYCADVAEDVTEGCDEAESLLIAYDKLVELERRRIHAVLIAEDPTGRNLYASLYATQEDLSDVDDAFDPTFVNVVGFAFVQNGFVVGT